MKEYPFIHWNGGTVRLLVREIDGYSDATKIVGGMNHLDYNGYMCAITQDEYGFKDMNLRRGDVVVDIGAYNGGEGIELGLLGLDIKTFSYDPIQENLDLYKTNVDRLGIKGITMYRKAVGAEKGTIKMWLPSKDPMHVGIASTLPEDKWHKDNPISIGDVEMTTLEDILKDNGIEKCAVLKLDCEGPEAEILHTAPRHILEKIDWIVGETHILNRKELLEPIKDLFNDVPCKKQEENGLCEFMYKRKGCNR